MTKQADKRQTGSHSPFEASSTEHFNLCIWSYVSTPSLPAPARGGENRSLLTTSKSFFTAWKSRTPEPRIRVAEPRSPAPIYPFIHSCIHRPLLFLLPEILRILLDNLFGGPVSCAHSISISDPNAPLQTTALHAGCRMTQWYHRYLLSRQPTGCHQHRPLRISSIPWFCSLLLRRSCSGVAATTSEQAPKPRSYDVASH